MITYSFIIPHRNSSKLLKRCINSIPNREDIQIIVVDDNSEETLDFIDNRPGLIVKYLDKIEAKRAGHARNVGIGLAKGIWLLFADADDYYNDYLLNILDKYKESKADVVYFNYYKIGKGCRKDTNTAIDNFQGDNYDLDIIKYRTNAPWNKMVRRQFVMENNIQFEETVNGNDMFFTYQVGYFARNIVVDKTCIYNYDTSTDGMTNKKKNTNDYYLCRLYHEYQINYFFEHIGHNEWITKAPFRLFIAVFYKKGFFEMCKCLGVYLQNYKKIKRGKHKFVNLMNK